MLLPYSEKQVLHKMVFWLIVVIIVISNSTAVSTDFGENLIKESTSLGFNIDVKTISERLDHLDI